MAGSRPGDELKHSLPSNHDELRLYRAKLVEKALEELMQKFPDLMTDLLQQKTSKTESKQTSSAHESKYENLFSSKDLNSIATYLFDFYIQPYLKNIKIEDRKGLSEKVKIFNEVIYNGGLKNKGSAREFTLGESKKLETNLHEFDEKTHYAQYEQIKKMEFQLQGMKKTLEGHVRNQAVDPERYSEIVKSLRVLIDRLEEKLEEQKNNFTAVPFKQEERDHLVSQLEEKNKKIQYYEEFSHCAQKIQLKLKDKKAQDKEIKDLLVRLNKLAIVLTSQDSLDSKIDLTEPKQLWLQPFLPTHAAERQAYIQKIMETISNKVDAHFEFEKLKEKNSPKLDEINRQFSRMINSAIESAPSKLKDMKLAKYIYDQCPALQVSGNNEKQKTDVMTAIQKYCKLESSDRKYATFNHPHLNTIDPVKLFSISQNPAGKLTRSASRADLNVDGRRSSRPALISSPSKTDLHAKSSPGKRAEQEVTVKQAIYAGVDHGFNGKEKDPNFTLSDELAKWYNKAFEEGEKLIAKFREQKDLASRHKEEKQVQSLKSHLLKEHTTKQHKKRQSQKMNSSPIAHSPSQPSSGAGAASAGVSPSSSTSTSTQDSPPQIAAVESKNMYAHEEPDVASSKVKAASGTHHILSQLSTAAKSNFIEPPQPSHKEKRTSRREAVRVGKGGLSVVIEGLDQSNRKLPEQHPFGVGEENKRDTKAEDESTRATQRSILGRRS